MCIRNNKEFEFHHDELEPEFGHERFDTNDKINGSAGRNHLKVLGNELLADIGTDLMLEPTVFREHSFNGLRSGARALPPTVPTSNLKVVAPSLKSCLGKGHATFDSPDHDESFSGS